MYGDRNPESDTVNKKVLGKIVRAEYGFHPDRHDIVSAIFDLSFDGRRVDGVMKAKINYKLTSNDNEISLKGAIATVGNLLRDAKVNYISELTGKPIEVNIQNGIVTDFRILTEVL